MGAVMQQATDTGNSYTVLIRNAKKRDHLVDAITEGRIMGMWT